MNPKCRMQLKERKIEKEQHTIDKAVQQNLYRNGTIQSIGRKALIKYSIIKIS